MKLIRCDACNTETEPELAARIIAPEIRTLGDRDELHLCRTCWHDTVAFVADRKRIFAEDSA